MFYSTILFKSNLDSQTWGEKITMLSCLSSTNPRINFMWLIEGYYINIALHKKTKEKLKKYYFIFINQINTISNFRFSNKIFT